MRGPAKGNVTLSDEDVRAVAVERLKDHVPLEVHGWKVSTEMVLDVLLQAAATGRSIEAVCDDLTAVADANTIREHINAQLNAGDLEELERCVNRALVEQLPSKLWQRSREVAFDLHDQPFYGTTPQLEACVCRGEARAGTTRFFRIATAYVMLDGLRVTLAVLFVQPTDWLPESLAALLRRVRLLGVAIRRLWLDKGFASIPIFEHLLDMRIPAIIACPIRGKKSGRGTRALCRGRASYATSHTFRSSKYGQCTVPVIVARTFTSGPRRRRRRARWLVFVQLNCHLRPDQVRRMYRRRFGIESSYRCMRRVRTRTASLNPALRFVFMALGMVLVNVWVTLRFLYCQIPQRGRGGRPLDEARFRLDRLKSFIRRAIERRYGVVSEIQADALPIHV